MFIALVILVVLPCFTDDSHHKNFIIIQCEVMITKGYCSVRIIFFPPLISVISFLQISDTQKDHVSLSCKADWK